MAEGEVAGWRPGVLASLARFWVVSLLLVLFGAAVGFLAASAQTAKATADASLVLSNPGDNSLTTDTGATYVNDQVAILRLPSTVAAAAKLLSQRVPGAQLDSETFQSELAVSSGVDSQLVTISVTDTRPNVAQAATAALVDTYTQVATKLQSDTRAAQIASIEANIAAINANIRVSATVAAQQQQQIQLYQQQIAQLTATGSTASGLIAASSPATLPTAKRTVPPALGLVAGALIGFAAAIALSRILAQARQRFGGRFEPELIFSTPLLADVPSFSAERLPSDLPSVDSATSSVTEAYRFATTALTSRGVTVVAVVSAASGEGKSSCAANLAVTAAYQGSRVLVVDADFEGKGVSFLLGQDLDRRRGLLDVLDGTVELDDVVVPVALADNLSLLTGGQAAGYDWPDVLSTSRWPQLTVRLSSAYDLVVIDLPPYLQIAYAVPIVRATDGVVVVIPHKSPVSRAAELAERLRFVGVEALGYLYVKAPLRRELGLVSRLATDEDRRPVQRGVTTRRAQPHPAGDDLAERRRIFFDSATLVVDPPAPQPFDVRADILPATRAGDEAEAAAGETSDVFAEEVTASTEADSLPGPRLVRVSLIPERWAATSVSDEAAQPATAGRISCPACRDVARARRQAKKNTPAPDAGNPVRNIPKVIPSRPG